MNKPLSPALIEQILAKLGLSNRPAPDLYALKTIYSAWCRHVPFDNVRKLVHLHESDGGRLPGNDAEDFFQAWLKYGTGGTCWASNGALQALLAALGFDALPGIATMLVVPDLPPNHGTVIVRDNDRQYIVDASILHGIPLEIGNSEEADSRRTPSTVRLAQRGERWHIWWQPLHLLAGIECRIDRFPVTQEEFRERHEQTRAWSPFNYQVTARLNRSDCAVGIGAGKWVEIRDSEVTTELLHSTEERNQSLIEKLGIAEEIVSRLPADRPTPPPPESETARDAAQHQ